MDLDKINIDYFSIDEVLDLFDLKKPVTRSEINLVADKKINTYKIEKTREFLINAKNKLIEYLNDNNVESIFGEENNLKHTNNIVQKEIGYDTNELILNQMNPLKRRLQKKIVVINTKDRELYITLELKELESSFTNDEKHFLNEFIEGQQRENLERVLTQDTLNDHEVINESFLQTVSSFDLKECLKKYDNELNKCVEGKINENYVSEYSSTIDENGLPLKKNCGSTNNRFIKNKVIEQNNRFNEITHTGPDSTRQYKENASNFLYDFNFKYNNIIKTTLLDIYIKKDIINLFVPRKSYYMIVLITDTNNNNKRNEVKVCVDFGKDNLSNIINQINSQINNNHVMFGLINEETKTYNIILKESVQTVTFIDNETCNYELSLSYKLNLLNKTLEFDDNTTHQTTIRFPDYLYFVYDDLTNNYHNCYHANTRESTLSSSVLAKIPLVGDMYKLDNTGSDLDAYSREYYGKVNVERARFQLLSPDGDLVNICQKDYVDNNYHFTLSLDCVYDI